jgi:hypothetical protein
MAHPLETEIIISGGDDEYVHRGGCCLFSNIVVAREYGASERKPAFPDRITATYQEQNVGINPFKISLENMGRPRKAGSLSFQNGPMNITSIGLRNESGASPIAGG